MTGTPTAAVGSSQRSINEERNCGFMALGDSHEPRSSLFPKVDQKLSITIKDVIFEYTT